MTEIEKIKEDILFLKFNLENELNEIRKQSEANLKFIKSQTEATKILNQLIKDNIAFMNDVQEKFNIKNIEINTLKLNIEALETQIRTQNIKIETLDYILKLNNKN